MLTNFGTNLKGKLKFTRMILSVITFPVPSDKQVIKCPVTMTMVVVTCLTAAVCLAMVVYDIHPLFEKGNNNQKLCILCSRLYSIIT